MEQSHEKAFELLRYGAEHGDAASQHFLGEFYENGTGTEKSVEKAIEWYGKAADQGYKDSIEALERLSESASRP